MLANGFNAPNVIQERDWLKLVEHSLNIDEVVFGLHFADTHPLGLPSLAKCLTGFGKAETLPLAFDQSPEEHAGLVPSRGEHHAAHVLPCRDVHVRLAGKAVPVLAVELEKPGLI